MRALKWIGWLFLAFVIVTATLVLSIGQFKGPITRAISKATGRELVIDGDLRIVPSLIHPRFRAERVTFANAEWGQYDYMLQADAIEATVSLAGLLLGRLVVPDVRLEGAALALEMDKEGRKNWILRDGDEEKKKESRVFIRHLTLDRGRLLYEDAAREISLAADLETNAEGVGFTVKGTYQGWPASAEGQGGPVLSLRDTDQPYPLKASAKIGDTTIKLDGRITELVGFRGIDTSIEISGKSMDDLYWIIGVAMPATSPYTTAGRLVRDGKVIRYENFTGKVGESDLGGTFQFDSSGARPKMTGDLVSKVLNLADLGSLVGTDQAREKEGVLPDMSFDPARWDSVDADVRLESGTIKRPKQIPLEKLTVRVLMKDSVLSLEPLDFGFAGGRLAGPVRMDGNQEPMNSSITMRVDKLQLAKLFPTIKEAQASLGNLGGAIDLKGKGNSVKDMLGTSNGKIALYMDGGRVSRTLMEMVALDLWKIAKLKLKGDQSTVEIRCAIADMDVKDGMANINAMIVDTAVVNVQIGGWVNLKTEEMNLKVEPKPKDKSIASLNSPLYVRGTFSQPRIAPDAELLAKGVGAIVMGVLNPLLAVIPLINEGPGKDSPCGQLIADALAQSKDAKAKAAASTASSGRSAASGATTRRPPSQSAR
ncbi:MAG TPA: AsmA family protein [Burkholderiales bacterium]